MIIFSDIFFSDIPCLSQVPKAILYFVSLLRNIKAKCPDTDFQNFVQTFEKRPYNNEILCVLHSLMTAVMLKSDFYCNLCRRQNCNSDHLNAPGISIAAWIRMCLEAVRITGMYITQHCVFLYATHDLAEEIKSIAIYADDKSLK